MVSECANPECRAQFLFFGQGKLLAMRPPANSRSGSHVEFFWLCGDCARHMDLHVSANGELTLVRESSELLRSA